MQGHGSEKGPVVWRTNAERRASQEMPNSHRNLQAKALHLGESAIVVVDAAGESSTRSEEGPLQRQQVTMKKKGESKLVPVKISPSTLGPQSYRNDRMTFKKGWK